MRMSAFGFALFGTLRQARNWCTTTSSMTAREMRLARVVRRGVAGPCIRQRNYRSASGQQEETQQRKPREDGEQRRDSFTHNNLCSSSNGKAHPSSTLTYAGEMCERCGVGPYALPGAFSFLRAAQRARAASDIFLRAAAEILRFGAGVENVTDFAFLPLFAGALSGLSTLPRTDSASSTLANSLQSRICSCFN